MTVTTRLGGIAVLSLGVLHRDSISNSSQVLPFPTCPEAHLIGYNALLEDG